MTANHPGAAGVGALVRRRRQELGWSQADLAARLGITRQALITIERGRSLPQLGLARALADHLGLSLDDLTAPLAVAAPAPWQWVGPEPVVPGPVYWALREGRLLLVPAGADPAGTAAADAWWDPVRHRLSPLPGAARPDRVLWLAGCDPHAGLLSRFLQEHLPGLDRVRVFPWGSRIALAALSRGAVDAAGSHLYDPVRGVYNPPALLEELAGGPVQRIRYCRWEAGLVGAATPETVRWWGVREPGSEARALFERRVGRPPVPVYEFGDHWSLAAFVRRQPGAAGVTVGSLAPALDLPFTAWAEESFDWVIPAADAGRPWAQALAEVLAGAAWRRTVRQLRHVDWSPAGDPA
ncbi:HTH cro/C1-type domain-containing protein [Candidatus Hydrogenisulfobacillus filiaventi]|uniref:HTH cro/C1-type domain-containing protein n=1 Tax=Candidatus Hydrogenisulfobacillus filiaventi TaxID=2707344 RepID=A0A6F8ZHJ7_9FIRM|nr:helix-turn-helix domain-containing protein [Bacillota bacterium]CAB1129149.1 HTH cro/C1-type domain-containing protein [Candidatus Hydrogenisulfobacillus filiaventi]